MVKQKKEVKDVSLTVFVNPDLHRTLKMAALAESITLKQLVNEILTKAMQPKPKKKKKK